MFQYIKNYFVTINYNYIIKNIHLLKKVQTINFVVIISKLVP